MSNSSAIPWTVAHQAPLSMRFPRQGYWCGLPFPSPGDLPNPGIEPMSPPLAGGFFTTEPLGKANFSSARSLIVSSQILITWLSFFFFFFFTCTATATAAAAKSLQSCPTLCNPIDSLLSGSSVSGILQARTLEWVAISFSNAWKWKVKVKSLSHVQLLATSWTAAYQAPPSMGYSRQEYWSGVPLPSLLCL